MRTTGRRDWWANDPAVAMCPIVECGCPIQRTLKGTVEDGMRLHFAYVHPGRTAPPVVRPQLVGGAS